MKQTPNITIEWAPFETTEHVTAEALLDAANKLEQQFLVKQPGYIRRELLQGDSNKWVDLVYWDSPQNAALAVKAADESDAFHEYFSLMIGVENAEDGIAHYKQVKTWN